MNELKGVFCGAGLQDWNNNRTGEVEKRPRVSLSEGNGLPRLLEADRDLVDQAVKIPVGTPVIATYFLNRYNQVQVKSLRVA